ncbi:MAG: hypothetical protein ABI658_23005 [Acidimicrobiales bacterium]
MVALVVDSSSACVELRCRLGATVWFVLEELVIGAEIVNEGDLRTRTSTRALASKLELNKDTVTRALAKLRACGVITAVTRGGATGASVFTISVPVGLLRAERVVAVEVAARRRKPRVPDERTQSVAQLSLLT